MKQAALLLVLGLIVSPGYGQQCSAKGMRRFDHQMAKFITIGGTGRKFPVNHAEVKVYCREQAEMLSELENYKNKCFKGLSKQVGGVLFYSLKSTMKSLCKKRSAKLDELLTVAPCLNRNDPKITKCYTTLVDSILGAQNANDKAKIPHLCCDVNVKFFHCIQDTLATAPGCNEKSVYFLLDFMKSIAQNAMDMVCGEYNDATDKCARLGKFPRNSLRNLQVIYHDRSITEEETRSEENQVVCNSNIGIVGFVS